VSVRGGPAAAGGTSGEHPTHAVLGRNPNSWPSWADELFSKHTLGLGQYRADLPG